ncbi:unnamed protein product [Pleuronectes platessa]|uniref:Uncharacterized protein n=1 Tax=Pleuronectes platessa TaxID=8262 RepID=A0A9N7VKM4_PLEPL|nr:unnamed protein product [Pleuronectes platessa]
MECRDKREEERGKKGRRRRRRKRRTEKKKTCCGTACLVHGASQQFIAASNREASLSGSRVKTASPRTSHSTRDGVAFSFLFVAAAGESDPLPPHPPSILPQRHLSSSSPAQLQSTPVACSRTRWMAAAPCGPE